MLNWLTRLLAPFSVKDGRNRIERRLANRSRNELIRASNAIKKIRK